MTNPKFKVGTKITVARKDDFIGEKGVVKKFDIDPKTNKVRYLVEGEGLKGAITAQKKCETCGVSKMTQSQNSRYYYEDMIEVDK